MLSAANKDTPPPSLCYFKLCSFEYNFIPINPTLEWLRFHLNLIILRKSILKLFRKQVKAVWFLGKLPTFEFRIVNELLL